MWSHAGTGALRRKDFFIHRNSDVIYEIHVRSFVASRNSTAVSLDQQCLCTHSPVLPRIDEFTAGMLTGKQ